MASIDPTKRTPAGAPARDTRWKVRYRKPNGRAGSKTFERKADAQRFLRLNGVDIDRDDWIDPKSRRVLFDTWADAYERGLVRLAPSTQRRYRQYLTNQIRPHFTGWPVSKIDYQDVESFIADLFADGLGAKSVRDAVSVLAQVLKAAVRGRTIRENPAAGHHIKVPRQRGQIASLEDLLRLVEHIPERHAVYRTAVLLLMYTGMRPAELAGLRVGRVNVLKGLVHVCEALTNVQGKLIPGPTKTDHERVLPIPRFMADQLAAHLALRAAVMGRPLKDDDYVVSATGKRGLDSKWLRSAVIVPGLRAAGLPTSFRTYDLRHAHASQLIDMGASPLAVKERLGHGDILTTFRRYGHLFAGVQDRLAAELEEAHHKAAEANKARDGAVVELRRQDG